ncbi:TPA: hypothetical protein QCG78_001580 [Enterobacter asburiae]|nr:hypothetical protein EATA8330_29200 [Enterobacter asburiae]HCM9581795.1 hypothetical protein [Enterobacter asburiae]HEC5299086.1 hypothetical protein [Enterobacter asburiae]
MPFTLDFLAIYDFTRTERRHDISCQISKDIPDYELARSLGLASGGEINFTALASQLDCSRNFSQVGIIYSDGARQWLVRPSRRIATPNESSVSHVVITKVNASSNNPIQATTATIQSPSLATEIGSTAISCGAAILTVVLAAGAGMAIPLTAGSSGAVAAVIVAGGVATGIQCANGLGRLSLKYVFGLIQSFSFTGSY